MKLIAAWVWLVGLVLACLVVLWKIVDTEVLVTLLGLVVVVVVTAWALETIRQR